jgi:hypothetical protein
LAVNPFYARILDGQLGTDIGNPWSSAPNGTMIVLYAATRPWATKNKEAVDGFRASLNEALAEPDGLTFWIAAARDLGLIKGNRRV